ncbi:MAG: phage holin family protein [Firmicutes bacterium]|nr:phage holin family protein [Bacillota bacterium]
MFKVEYIWDYIAAVLLAVAGGIARLISVTSRSRKKIKASMIAGELFVSGLIGLLFMMWAVSQEWSGGALGALCGMAGYLGTLAFKWLGGMALKKFGVDERVFDGTIEDRKSEFQRGEP